MSTIIEIPSGDKIEIVGQCADDIFDPHAFRCAYAENGAVVLRSDPNDGLDSHYLSSLEIRWLQSHLTFDEMPVIVLMRAIMFAAQALKVFNKDRAA